MRLSKPLGDYDASSAQLEYRYGFGRSKRSYLGLVALPGLAGTSTSQVQEISEWNLSAGAAIKGRKVVQGKWTLSASLGLDAIYYNADYDGTHEYRCAPCAPADRAFTQVTGDSESGLTWGARMNGTIGYRVDPRSELFAGMNLRYRDDVAMIEPRVTPLDPAPHTTTDDVAGYYVNIGFRRDF